MGVDAANAAEAVDIAHKPHLFHVDGVIVADANILNFTHTGDIDQHLPIDQGGDTHQRIANLVRKELVRGHLHIVKQQHFIQNDVSNAARIAVNFSFHAVVTISVSASFAFLSNPDCALIHILSNPVCVLIRIISFPLHSDK